MNCISECSICYPTHQLYLTENKDLTDSPLYAIQQGIIIKPKQRNGVLHLPKQQISDLFCRTLIYQTIKELDVSYNLVTYIPEILTLRKLKCTNCKLNKLPNAELLPHLVELNCSDNLLIEIPNYQSLKKLECSINYISELPKYNKLTHLTCNNNPITDIYIPSLEYLEALGCCLTVIYNLPLLYKKSSVLINGDLKYIICKREKIDNRYKLIDWRNSTCSSLVKDAFLDNDMLSMIYPMLFEN
jgi:Leucine-rich repeat (LRR) protein